jgi:hypothetical protein
MVQFRAIDRRLSADDMIRKFEQNAASVQEGVLKGLATKIAQLSPVDTGTYATSHRVAPRSGSCDPFKQMTGPRKQEAGVKQIAGLQIMLTDIESIFADNKPKANIAFRNEALHAKYVEHGGRTPQGVATPARKVYTVARSEVKTILADTLAKLGFKS